MKKQSRPFAGTLHNICFNPRDILPDIQARSHRPERTEHAVSVRDLARYYLILKSVHVNGFSDMEMATLEDVITENPVGDPALFWAQIANADAPELAIKVRNMNLVDTLSLIDALEIANLPSQT